MDEILHYLGMYETLYCKSLDNLPSQLVQGFFREQTHPGISCL